MGKVNGFLEAGRIENPFRPEAARLCDDKALHTPLAMEQRQTQASRCMNCGVPATQSGTHRIRPGLFAAGDLRTGQSLVVRAITDGLAAADEVHAELLAQ